MFLVVCAIHATLASFLSLLWVVLEGDVFGTLSLAVSLAVLGALIAAINTVTAKPNCYLLVFRDGRLIKSGIGLRHFRWWNDSTVSIPATMNKVAFRAEQVTSEMQGLRVEGVVIWTIYRDGEGPVKAYRYLDGLTKEGLEKANGNIKDMAESIVRTQVANMTIEEVVRNRHVIRDACRKAMGEVVQGWGVWLETVEVYEVKVLSASLFENLQAKFRERTRLEAEEGRISTETHLDKTESEARAERERARQDAEMAMARHRQETAEERRKLERMELEAAAEMDKVRQRIDMETRLGAVRVEAEVEEARARAAREAQKAERQFRDEMESQALESALLRRAREAQVEAEMLKVKISAQQSMNETNKGVMYLETVRDVFSHIGPGMKVVNVASAPLSQKGSSGLESLLPGLTTAWEVLQGAQDRE